MGRRRAATSLHRDTGAARGGTPDEPVDSGRRPPIRSASSSAPVGWPDLGVELPVRWIEEAWSPLAALLATTTAGRAPLRPILARSIWLEQSPGSTGRPLPTNCACLESGGCAGSRAAGGSAGTGGLTLETQSPGFPGSPVSGSRADQLMAAPEGWLRTSLPPGLERRWQQLVGGLGYSAFEVGTIFHRPGSRPPTRFSVAGGISGRRDTDGEWPGARFRAWDLQSLFLAVGLWRFRGNVSLKAVNWLRGPLKVRISRVGGRLSGGAALAAPGDSGTEIHWPPCPAPIHPAADHAFGRTGRRAGFCCWVIAAAERGPGRAGRSGTESVGVRRVSWQGLPAGTQRGLPAGVPRCRAHLEG